MGFTIHIMIVGITNPIFLWFDIANVKQLVAFLHAEKFLNPTLGMVDNRLTKNSLKGLKLKAWGIAKTGIDIEMFSLKG